MRILALLPAATDIVVALGAVDLLVGVTHECDAPGLPPAVPRVTSSAIDATAAPAAIDASVRALDAAGQPLFRLDHALIAALRPDLIITQALCDVCAVSEDEVRSLADRLEPKPRIVTLGASTLDGVLDEIQRVADALGRGDEGFELALGLRNRMRAVHTVLKAARAPRPRVAVIEWTNPIYAAGHWAPEIVRRAGGIDVLAQPGEHSAPRRVSQVRESQPDVIIVAPCGCGLARAADEGRELLSRDEWTWARELSVFALDANAVLSRPGSRLVDGVETIARVLHPTLFSPLRAERAVRLP